jgi:hypothetical protein
MGMRWGRIGHVNGGVVAVLVGRVLEVRSFWALIVETCRCCGMEVLRAWAQFSAVVMTKSYGVIDGFVRYLCLKNAAPKI